MRIKSTVSYPINTPTLNGNIYGKEALELAFKDKAFTELNEAKAIPVHYVTGSYGSDTIGLASARLLENGHVEVEAELFDKPIQESLHDEDTLNKAGIILSGMCTKTYEGVLSNIEYREALLTMHPAIHCSMEIVKE